MVGDDDLSCQGARGARSYAASPWVHGNRHVGMVVVTNFAFTSAMRACRVSSSAASLQVRLRRAWLPWLPGPHGALSGGGAGPLIYMPRTRTLHTQGLRRQAAAVCIYVSSYLHWRVRLLPVCSPVCSPMCSLSALCLLPARMVPVLPAPPSLGLHTQSSVIW